MATEPVMLWQKAPFSSILRLSRDVIFSCNYLFFEIFYRQSVVECFDCFRRALCRQPMARHPAVFTSTLVDQMSCDSFFTTFTWLGSLYFLLPCSVILSLLLLRIGRPAETMLLALSLFATVLAVYAAKLLFRRSRPDSTELLIPMPTDWSFPSAHTAQATAFFLSITLIALRLLPPFWALLTALFSLLIVAGVGYSRIYLQVHYLSDVVAGLTLAIVLVLAVQAFVSPHGPPFGK